MASKEKVKDVGPAKAEYQENTLYKALTAHSTECNVIPEGALLLAGMSIQTYPTFKTVDGGKFLKCCGFPVIRINTYNKTPYNCLLPGALLVPGEVSIHLGRRPSSSTAWRGERPTDAHGELPRLWRSEKR
ncbi:hypothetical protein Hanom_Chr11g00972011 [Helianthus anomalus]